MPCVFLCEAAGAEEHPGTHRPRRSRPQGQLAKGCKGYADSFGRVTPLVVAVYHTVSVPAMGGQNIVGSEASLQL